MLRLRRKLTKTVRCCACHAKCPCEDLEILQGAGPVTNCTAGASENDTHAIASTRACQATGTLRYTFGEFLKKLRNNKQKQYYGVFTPISLCIFAKNVRHIAFVFLENRPCNHKNARAQGDQFCFFSVEFAQTNWWLISQ